MTFSCPLTYDIHDILLTEIHVFRPSSYVFIDIPDFLRSLQYKFRILGRHGKSQTKSENNSHRTHYEYHPQSDLHSAMGDHRRRSSHDDSMDHALLYEL